MVRLCEHRRAGPFRRGFTLIELLVVIAIIGILAALTTGAVMRFMAAQPISNTRLTITKLQSLLRKKWTEVTDQARKDTIQGIYATAVKADGGGDVERERIIYVKIKQRQAFPETYYEEMNGFTVGGVAIPASTADIAYLKKYGIVSPSNSGNPAVHESSVCLLMSLKRGGVGASVTDADIGDDAISTNVSGANGAPCLVDAWRNPLAFTRWPMGSTLAPVADPSDPQGWLSKANWVNTPGGKDFGKTMHAVNSTGRLTPAIASMGAKGGIVLEIANPGLATHWQVTNAAQTDDVIYSFNLP